MFSYSIIVCWSFFIVQHKQTLILLIRRCLEQFDLKSNLDLTMLIFNRTLTVSLDGLQLNISNTNDMITGFIKCTYKQDEFTDKIVWKNICVYREWASWCVMRGEVRISVKSHIVRIVFMCFSMKGSETSNWLNLHTE